MKKTTLTLAMAALITTFAGADVASAGRIADRQIRQQKRIHQGIRSGELTRRETFRLEKQQHKIQRHKRKAWRDGTLTPKERVRLERGQNRTSKRIYRMKHNNIKRPGN